MTKNNVFIRKAVAWFLILAVAVGAAACKSNTLRGKYIGSSYYLEFSGNTVVFGGAGMLSSAEAMSKGTFVLDGGEITFSDFESLMEVDTRIPGMPVQFNPGAILEGIHSFKTDGVSIWIDNEELVKK